MQETGIQIRHPNGIHGEACDGMDGRNGMGSSPYAICTMMGWESVWCVLCGQVTCTRMDINMNTRVPYESNLPPPQSMVGSMERPSSRIEKLRWDGWDGEVVTYRLIMTLAL